MITPCHLEILMHYYVSPTVYPQHDAPAVIEYTQWLVDNGVLESHLDGESGYEVTEKGKAWIDLILATPMPVMKWCDPRELQP